MCVCLCVLVLGAFAAGKKDRRRRTWGVYFLFRTELSRESVPEGLRSSGPLRLDEAVQRLAVDKEADGTTADSIGRTSFGSGSGNHK